MKLRLYDVTMPSINPTAQVGTLSGVPPTGGGAVTVGSSTTPGLATPTVEPIYRVVSDIGVSGVVASYGMLVSQQFVSTNYGGTLFAAWTGSSNQPIPRFSYGVVVEPVLPYINASGQAVANIGGQAMICVEGIAQGLVYNNSWVVGNRLAVAGGANTGQLGNYGGAGVGVTLGYALTTGAQTIGLMKVGGY
jgi:hypothetical protein